MTPLRFDVRARGALTLAFVLVLAGGRPAAAAGELENPQELFWSRLEALCGQAFAGRLDEAAPGTGETFAGRTLTMHVRRCTADRIEIPFHLGENRSRTWILTRTAGGLRLKHDHRHADGSEERLTQYGGDTLEPGTPTRQEFPADLFTARLLPAAATNIWALELEPGVRFVYELRRAGDERRFAVEFDLSQPIAPPPPPGVRSSRALGRESGIGFFRQAAHGFPPVSAGVAQRQCNGFVNRRLSVRIRPPAPPPPWRPGEVPGQLFPLSSPCLPVPFLPNPIPPFRPPQRQ
jgi:hypothetical protein